MKKEMEKEMIVAGIMSGTSADGVNVAFIKFGEKTNRKKTGVEKTASSKSSLPFELLGHAEFPYPKQIRAAILNAMNAQSACVADLARLNFLLGEIYSDAVIAAQSKLKVKANLIGCHGQTLYHQGNTQSFLGRRIATTWQTGEAAIIAARTGAPVVSDFRPTDMAAGGKGAPLVPFLDYILFRDRHVGRIAQNIGGIANLTAIPARATADQVIAFDTGPGNMVIDAVTQKFFNRPFDRNGRIAASGTVLDEPLRAAMRHKFFRKLPPKTAGREEFGREYVEQFLKSCGSGKKEDAIATATALTAISIRHALERHILRNSKLESKSGVRKRGFQEMILSGGGARNPTLVAILAAELAPLGLRLKLSDEFGLPSQAKEAIAFASLAYETWHRRPSNVPSATGAKRPAILGKISYP
jgi:anhydro-N-acetylmuramic acid kinase